MTATNAAPVRVVLAEDAVFLREAIARFLRQDGFDVVAEVGDRPGLLDAVTRTRPDVTVVDIRMPPTYQTEGRAATIEIRDGWPGVELLLLSQHLETRYLTELLGAGAGVPTVVARLTGRAAHSYRFAPP